MEKSCKITEAEWQIMKVIWEKRRITAAEIIETLKTSTDWSPKTIHSLISRLVSKGAISKKKSAAQYEYAPLVSRDDCIKDEAESMAKKLYGGSFFKMVSNFIDDDKMSKNEIEALKKILDDKLK